MILSWIKKLKSKECTLLKLAIPAAVRNNRHLERRELQSKTLV